ncbi:MFS general substrate transporter [Lactarius indigo]|nr:MFS general substrate transporter [Lactarius indigo]
MFSTPDLLSFVFTINEKVLPVSRGTANPEGWDEEVVPDPLEPKPPAPPRSTIASVCIVAACTSSLMMTIALGPSVSILLPYAGKDLHIQKESLQWIVNAYSISSACFLLLCGRLADLYGRKRVWLSGYSILAVFSIGAGFAQSSMVLDILRGVQGLGAAALIPASLGILAKAFPPGPSRPIAFATFSAGAPIGGVFCNVVGGVLTQLTEPTWRSPMFLFAGVSFAWTILGFFVFEEDEPSTEEDRRVDWIGAALITAGLVLIVFVLSDSPSARKGWKNPHIIALFVVGVLLVIVFVAWQYYLERRLENPDLPRTLWTAPPLMKPSMWTRAHGRFAVMQIIACVNSAAFACWLVWVQLYYQTYLGLAPIQTMPRMLPLFFVGTGAGVFVAFTIGRIDVVYIVATGTLMTACADLLFAVIDPSAPFWAFAFPSACLVALGADFTFAAGTIFIAKVSLPHEQSVAGALIQAMTQIGSAIGVSVSTIVFNGVLGAQSNRPGVVPDAQLKAYKAAMWTGFAFGLLCTILCVIFLRGVGIVGEKPEQELSARRSTEDGG